MSNDELTRRQVLVAAGTLVAGGAAIGAGCDRAPQSTGQTMKPERLPTLYLPHGGGPCFFMDWTMGPADTWVRTRGWLEEIGRRFDGVSALLVVSAHWEELAVTVQTGTQPGLLFDYSGFPAHTYELTWPAPGAPKVAARALSLLRAAGIEALSDAERGFDHGVFVPLKVAFPRAHIPTFQVSLRRGLSPAEHLEIGKALAPLRDEGVLIVGSGMSFHNMRAFGRPGSLAVSQRFDSWLESVCHEPRGREDQLVGWDAGPEARACHPREEHLLPLMVVAGAARADQGRNVFRDDVMGVTVSAIEFGGA